MIKSKNLIFLFSLPRSGSTLLQRLLTAHEDICSTSECWFLLPLIYMKKRYGSFSEYGSIESYKAIVDYIENFPNKEVDYDDVIKNTALTFYDLANTGKTLFFLEKTPRYYLIIPEIAKMFPDSKFIILCRNPLGVMSSIIRTWNNGKMRMHRNYIDLIKGPKLLGDGCEILKQRHIMVKYEELLKYPEMTFKKIFEYLDLEFRENIVDEFSFVKFKGRQGDKGELSRKKNIDYLNIDKWKNTFNTNYRKKIAKKYINNLGATTIANLGYDLKTINSEIDEIRGRPGFSLIDRYDIIVGKLIRTFELLLFRRKIKEYSESSYKSFFLLN